MIDLDDGNEVRGLNLDPQGTGGGIAGASGDTGGGTIDDINIVDTGTAGTQPGLELDATTGTFNISNLTVNTNGAIGVRLNNAGTVNFAAAGTISITTAGASGLDAAGATTSFGYQHDRRHHRHRLGDRRRRPHVDHRHVDARTMAPEPTCR